MTDRYPLVQIPEHLPSGGYWRPTIQGDQEAEWFTPAEVDELPLHPDFRKAWNEVRPSFLKTAATPLYHWVDASDLEGWMDPSHTGPGQTYLTTHGDAPDNESWNPDVPWMDNPVRLTIDVNQLDPDGFDPEYGGWLGNELYRGVIPQSAILDVKPFKKPETWNMNPNQDDHWPDYGQRPEDELHYHDVQFSGDGRTAMAADPYWLDNWIERNGPYLWHKTEMKNVPNILRRGLLPWDHPESPGTQFAGALRPRPNHVYLRRLLTDRPASKEYIRVDLRKLHPENLNPDEDHFSMPSKAYGPLGHPLPSRPSDASRIWNLPIDQRNFNWADRGNYPDWGAWAEGENLSHPSQTAWSLERPDMAGTIAHRGIIPPEALDQPQVLNPPLM